MQGCVAELKQLRDVLLGDLASLAPAITLLMNDGEDGQLEGRTKEREQGECGPDASFTSIFVVRHSHQMATNNGARPAVQTLTTLLTAMTKAMRV